MRLKKHHYKTNQTIKCSLQGKKLTAKQYLNLLYLGCNSLITNELVLG